jgi:Ser/Thr protein kinase RdoA (MazF antagonist)
MQHPEPPDLAQITAAFAVGPAIGPIEPLGRGLINDTFCVVTAAGSFVLQRINPRVFPDPERIMANLVALSEHASGYTGTGLRIPSLLRAADGTPFVRAADGALWRLMERIPDGVSLAHIEQPDQARGVGGTLGRFHRLTSDLSPGRLGLAFPGFHRTPDYLERHLAARNRAAQTALAVRDDEQAGLQACFDFIDTRHGLAQVLEQALVAGQIRERVTHGDPKLDNILFHREEGRALALIDLDTVQPGLIQHDLGDCLRSCCNRVGESPEQGVVATFDLDLCADILDAYAAETRDVLGPGDVAVLYDSIRLMPFELALRFLTDHLEGDRYFRVAFRGQNLHKARIQLALVADIESKEQAIRAMIAAAFPDHTFAD